MRKVIISVAPVAGPDPLRAEELIHDVIQCEQEGASMCHLHCKTRVGALTPDITNISEALELIRTKTNLILQASTGGISDMTMVERCYPLQYPYVESASLNGVSTNLGEAIYKNSL